MLDSREAGVIRSTAQVTARVHWHTRRTAEIRVAGEIDLLTVPRLLRALSLVRDLGAANILVNLDEVTFLGVVGVHALADVATRAHLRVTRLSREAARTLALADPDRIVPRPSSATPCASDDHVPLPRRTPEAG